MRAVNLVRLILLPAVSVLLAPAYSTDLAAVGSRSPIVPPSGLVSVIENPAAMATIRPRAGNPALQVVDAYLATLDIAKIQKGEKLGLRRHVIVFQPTDSQFRFPSQETFSALVGDMRRRFLGPEQISHANAYMKARGDDSELVSTDGDRILVDEANCFAIATHGQYKIDGDSSVPSMALGVAYVRIDRRLFILYLLAKGDAPEEKMWLAKDVPAWLRSLPARN